MCGPRFRAFLATKLQLPPPATLSTNYLLWRLSHEQRFGRTQTSDTVHVMSEQVNYLSEALNYFISLQNHRLWYNQQDLYVAKHELITVL